jgi:hypothetical protein
MSNGVLSLPVRPVLTSVIIPSNILPSFGTIYTVVGGVYWNNYLQAAYDAGSYIFQITIAAPNLVQFAYKKF